MASNVPECKPLSFLMVVSEKHLALDDDLIDASGVRELGGSLEEIKTSLPERLLTRFMSQPAKTHWQAGF